MLFPRIIPCLTIDEFGDMVKTTNFKYDSRRYVGDIENAVRIFNEKKADEIIVLDIDSTTKLFEPKYEIIEKIASSCRMPLSYGGGIKTLDQTKKIINLGVEKIILSSIIFENISLVKKISDYYGSQSVAVCLDVVLKENKIILTSHNGSKFYYNIDILDFIKEICMNKVGELILNLVDRDGTMNGYDLNVIKQVFKVIPVPLTLLGGAGKLAHFTEAISKYKISGLAAGSYFIYKSKNKGVLINYPTKKEIFNL